MRAIELAEKAIPPSGGRRVANSWVVIKGDSDDVRESRAIPLAKALLDKGADVVGYDLEANDAFRAIVPAVEIAGDAKSALAHADLCIVHNDWPQWRELRPADFSSMDGKVVVDGRRILTREAMKGVTLVVLGG